jgi:hypothetical protein
MVKCVLAAVVSIATVDRPCARTIDARYDRQQSVAGFLSRNPGSKLFRLTLINKTKRLMAINRYDYLYEVRIFDASNSQLTSNYVFLMSANLRKSQAYQWVVMRPEDEVSFCLTAFDKERGVMFSKIPATGHVECSTYTGLGRVMSGPPEFVRKSHAEIATWDGTAVMRL